MEVEDDGFDDSSSLESDEYNVDKGNNIKSKLIMKQPRDSGSDEESDVSSEIDDDSDHSRDAANLTSPNHGKRKLEKSGDEYKLKKLKLGLSVETPKRKNGELSDSDVASDSENQTSKATREPVWEDIYGRLRTTDGSVLEVTMNTIHNLELLTFN